MIDFGVAKATDQKLTAQDGTGQADEAGQGRAGLDRMEKDRNRRYETANGLAMDVQRYLSGEPVQTCPAATPDQRRNPGR